MKSEMINDLSFENWMPEVTPVGQQDAGSVAIDRKGPFIAGSFQRFTLTYTAGRYGIDDSGCLKICYRFASDMGRPQFTDPAAPNWVGVSASNGAVLDVRFDYKQNTRPWDRTIYIKVVAGFMKEGDQIVVNFGTDERGPGMRMQTFVDPEFCFRVLVDPIATYTFVDVPNVPALPIIPGPAYRWYAVLPTCRAVGDSFSLKIRADDVWGNPTSSIDLTDIELRASTGVDGLPSRVQMKPDELSYVISNLTVRNPGNLLIDILAPNGGLLATSNKLVIKESMEARPYWGDLHAQSGETIGSGSALAYFEYAKNCAFLDIVSHQGNDFQITGEFWLRLNLLMQTWNQPGTFVTIPGYEWSGNTALGGDRNVFYRTEDKPIRRSSHALVPDRSDIDSDCWDARALFDSLRSDYPDVVVWAHCGGRYADIKYAHDHALERSVEIHSSWGTFEWLAADAFESGYRVGIVGNSDGHKGRPGSEPPGASMFGALGGLTCYWLDSLDRDAVFDALQARHHYATTGSRVHLFTEIKFDDAVTIWGDDPRIGNARSYSADKAVMGDIVSSKSSSVEFSVNLESQSPILSVEIRRGTEVLEVIRPHDQIPSGNRIRVEWSGAEYRGRARQTVWDGSLTVSGAKIVDYQAVNFFNPDRPLRQISDTELAWSSITTGNISGVDLLLSGAEGEVEIKTPHGSVKKSLSRLSHTPEVAAFGKLSRELRISRQPDSYSVCSMNVTHRVDLVEGDNPLWICATFADGHQAWSSPIYLLK